MSVNYPGALDSFVAKQDGPTHKIMAAHINKLQEAVVAVETELGTDPAGSLDNLKARLAVSLFNNGKLKWPQQIVTAGKTLCQYTLIQSAINSISDAASDKIYTILVFPGFYNEAITLKNWVNIVAIDPKSTFILQQVSDNNVECHCYLNITITSASGHGLYTRNADTVITIDGNINSSTGIGAYCTEAIQIINGNVSSSNMQGASCSGSDGTQTINGNVSSSVECGITCSGGNQTINGNVISSANAVVICSSGIQIINGNINCTYNNANGHGVHIGFIGICILQNGKIICTHADAKAISASSAKNVRCMGVWANRDLDEYITNLITGGFTYDIDVQ